MLIRFVNYDIIPGLQMLTLNYSFKYTGPIFQRIRLDSESFLLK